MIVGQRGVPDAAEGVRTMVGTTAGKPGVEVVFPLAYAAGTAGIFSIPVWFVFLGRYLGALVG